MVSRHWCVRVGKMKVSFEKGPSVQKSQRSEKPGGCLVRNTLSSVQLLTLWPVVELIKLISRDRWHINVCHGRVADE
jgi:hypothetical protein